MKESVQTEVSRLLQTVIPVLDALHTLPFHNHWLWQTPGQDFVQFVKEIEKWLLWLWQKLQQSHPMSLQWEIATWEGSQHRKQDGVLQQYYRFYEAFGVWEKAHADEIWRQEGWSGYVWFVLKHEKHLLVQQLQGNFPAKQEELLLIAKQYLKQMQLIDSLDPYLLCLEFFTLVGVFTKKSYFVPQLTFSALETKTKEAPKPHTAFFHQLNHAEQWSELATEYLNFLQQFHARK